MVSTGDFLGPVFQGEFDSSDLYEQFLDIKVGETDAFTLVDADGNSATYVKDPFPEYRWCNRDCKEYDKEKHCCHRFSTVIRETVAEIEREYKLTGCIDCKYLDSSEDYCDKWKRNIPDYGGGCTWGRPKDDNGGSEHEKVKTD